MEQNNTNYKLGQDQTNSMITTNTKPHRSRYALSICDPKNVITDIPDQDMTWCNKKVVLQTLDITVPNGAKGDFLLIWVPGNNRFPLQIWVSIAGVYFFWRNIPMDQNLGENYTFGRLISAIFEGQSSTTSGTLFNISGTINALAFQQLPDIAQLTYNTLTPYLKDGVSKAIGVNVDAGIVCLASPLGKQNFRIFDNDHAFTTQNELITKSTPSTDAPAWTSVINLPVVNTPVVLYNSLLSVAKPLPDNVNGPFKASAQVTFMSTVAASIRLTVIKRTLRANDDWLTTTAVDTISTAYIIAAVAGPNTINVEDYFNSPYPTTSIQMTLETANAATVLTLSGGGYSTRLIVSYPNYYEEGQNFPGYIVGVQSMSPGQTFTMSGQYNYEVVPDSSLSKEIATSGPSADSSSPMEIQLVQAFLSDPQFGMKFVWTKPAYEKFLEGRLIMDLTDLNYMAKAAGWPDWLTSIWNAAKPIVKQALPLVGGLIHPIGGMVGQALGDLIPESSMRRGKVAMYGARSALLNDGEIANKLEHIPELVDISLINLTGVGANYEQKHRQNMESWLTSQIGGLPVKECSNTFPIATEEAAGKAVVFISTKILHKGTHPCIQFTNQTEDKPVYLSIMTNDGVSITKEMSEVDSMLWLYDLAVALIAKQSTSRYITIITPMSFTGMSCGAAIEACKRNITLPYPITGAFDPETGQGLLPALLASKVQIGPLFITGTYEDLAALDLKEENVARMIFDGENPPLIVHDNQLEAMATSMNLPVVREYVKTISGPAKSNGKLSDFIDTFRKYDINDLVIVTGLDEEMVVPLNTVIKFWDKDINSLDERVLEKSANSINTGREKIALDLPVSVKKQNADLIRRNLNTLASIQFQLLNTSPEKRTKTKEALTSFPTFVVSDSGEKVVIDNIENELAELANYPDNFKINQAAMIEAIKDKWNALVNLEDVAIKSNKIRSALPQWTAYLLKIDTLIESLGNIYDVFVVKENKQQKNRLAQKRAPNPNNNARPRVVTGTVRPRTPKATPQIEIKTRAPKPKAQPNEKAKVVKNAAKQNVLQGFTKRAPVINNNNNVFDDEDEEEQYGEETDWSF